MAFNQNTNSKSGILPLMEKLSSLLMYAVVAVEVIDFARQKYIQLQKGTYQADKEAAIEDVQ